MSKKIYLIDLNGEHTITVENEEFIGRDHLQNCEDKTISRKHAIFRIEADKIVLTGPHKNPAYYRTKSNSFLKSIRNNGTVELEEGDQVGFLPDKFWYRISHSHCKLQDVAPTPDMCMAQVEPESSRVRNTCKFGTSCYRTNQSHLSELAHPGDVDYIPVQGTKYIAPNISPNPKHERRNLRRKHFYAGNSQIPETKKIKISNDGSSEDDDDESYPFDGTDEDETEFGYTDDE